MGKLLYALIIGAFVTGLSGCAGTPEAGSPAEKTALQAWAGTWNNFYSYLERPALDSAYTALAGFGGKGRQNAGRNQKTVS